MNKDKAYELVKSYPDFPKPGIEFFDLSPIYYHAHVMRDLISGMTIDILTLDTVVQNEVLVDAIIAPDARGFILGNHLSDRLNCAFVPVRKKGKLPGELFEATYDLEYGTDALYMQKDALIENKKVIIHDDLLATGGTALAAADLVKQAGGEVLGFSFTAELDNLGGRAKLETVAPVVTYLHF